ncbi:MAG: hypothetical protein WB660_16780 [Candidatus Sulfotelmatobacter sp.]
MSNLKFRPSFLFPVANSGGRFLTPDGIDSGGSPGLMAAVSSMSAASCELNPDLLDVTTKQ